MSNEPTSPARLAGADITLVIDGRLDDLIDHVRAATAGSAFRLVGTEQSGHLLTARFVTDVVVAWGSILDLQHRLHRVGEVVSVERRTAADLFANA
jgi:hypothetical protein